MTKDEIRALTGMFFSTPKKPRARKKRVLAASAVTGGALGAALSLKIGNAGLVYGGTAICIPPWAFILAVAGLFLGLASFLLAVFN